MILTALFKLIELLTVKPNSGQRLARNSKRHQNQTTALHENVSTHSAGTGDRAGATTDGRNIRDGLRLHSPSYSRDGRHIRHGLFIPFHDD